MPLPKNLAQKWAEAERNPDTKVALGRDVVCDVCSTDYTEQPEQGGFIFGSYAYCPKCAARAEPEIINYGEESYIRARCLDGQSFADFVRVYRGPDSYIRVTTL